MEFQSLSINESNIEHNNSINNINNASNLLSDDKEDSEIW